MNQHSMKIRRSLGQCTLNAIRLARKIARGEVFAFAKNSKKNK